MMRRRESCERTPEPKKSDRGDEATSRHKVIGMQHVQVSPEGLLGVRREVCYEEEDGREEKVVL